MKLLVFIALLLACFTAIKNDDEGYGEWEVQYQEQLREELDNLHEQLSEVKLLLADGETFNREFNQGFRRYDLDESDTIDEAELQQLLVDIAQQEGIPAPHPDETYYFLQWFDRNLDGVLQRQEAVTMLRYLLTSAVWGNSSTIGWIEIELGDHQLPALPIDGESAQVRLDDLYYQQNEVYTSIWFLESQIGDQEVLRNTLEQAWQENDWDASGDLSKDEAYSLVSNICDWFSLETPSEEDFEWGFQFLDSNHNGSIDSAEFKVAIDLFLVPALVDTFSRQIRETTYLNAEIDEIYWSGLLGDFEEAVPEDSDPYWDGYNHGWQDGYAEAYFELTGSYPNLDNEGEDYYDDGEEEQNVILLQKSDNSKCTVPGNCKESKEKCTVPGNCKENKEKCTVPGNCKENKEKCTVPGNCKENKEKCTVPGNCKENKEKCTVPGNCKENKEKCTVPGNCKENKEKCTVPGNCKEEVVLAQQSENTKCTVPGNCKENKEKCTVPGNCKENKEKCTVPGNCKENKEKCTVPGNCKENKEKCTVPGNCKEEVVLAQQSENTKCTVPGNCKQNKEKCTVPGNCKENKEKCTVPGNCKGSKCTVPGNCKGSKCTVPGNCKGNKCTVPGNCKGSKCTVPGNCKGSMSKSTRSSGNPFRNQGKKLQKH